VQDSSESVGALKAINLRFRKIVVERESFSSQVRVDCIGEAAMVLAVLELR